MNSLKKNVVYSSILTVSNYIFPLIVFPYVNRVLGVANIGTCNFVDNVIDFFILFSMMGMSSVALREIVKHRTDKKQLSNVFSSLFTLNLITTIFVIIVLFVLTAAVPEFQQNKYLMYVGSGKVLFNFLTIEWLYRGLEDFKFITYRKIAVKIVYVFLVFLFVKKADDYIIYYALTVLVFGINAVINLFYSRHFVTFTIKNLSIKPFIKPFVILGVYALLTSMYTSFNVIYLGFVSGENEVGYYTTATRLQNVILALFTAFTGVMLPRMTALIKEGDNEEVERLYRKSMDILLVFAFPLVAYFVVMAPQVIAILAGKGFEAAIPCMQLTMPLIFVIGLEQVLIIQLLLPLGKDKYVLIGSIIGSIGGVLANIILVPLYQSIGSSFAWIISELLVLGSAYYFVKKSINLPIGGKKILINGLYSLVFSVMLFLIIKITNLGLTLDVIISLAFFVVYYYLLYIVILKEPVLTDFKKSLFLRVGLK